MPYVDSDSSPSDSAEEPLPLEPGHLVEPGGLEEPHALPSSSPGGPPTPLSSTPDREGSSDHSEPPGAMSSTPISMATRAYQQEMLEESLKRNIILTVRTKASPLTAPSDRLPLRLS